MLRYWKAVLDELFDFVFVVVVVSAVLEVECRDAFWRRVRDRLI